jgi:uncharacterized protein
MANEIKNEVLHANEPLPLKKSTTLVLGATTNAERYAFLATQKLLQHGFKVALVGIKKGEVSGIPIQNGCPALTDIDTITLYLSAENQKQYYTYILETLKPRRLIFNPGTENTELVRLARAEGIEPIMACTLVMLSTGQYGETE